MFINALHGTSRNSFIFRLTKNCDVWKSKAYRDNALELMVSGQDEYISINSFSSYSRGSNNVREIKEILFDLDLHDKPMEIVDEAIDNTLHLINGAVEFRQLPKPTMICTTGRGLQLHYVLESSIPCCLSNSQKSINYYKVTYNLLHQRLLEIMADGLYDTQGNKAILLKIDSTCVNDVSRVCRLPGTLNRVANRYCELVYFDEFKKYSLKDINNTYFAEEWDQMAKNRYKKKWKKRIKKIDADTIKAKKATGDLCQFRVNALRELQKIRGYDCRNHREYMAFLFYNHAKQIYGNELGFALLLQYNSHFIVPLKPCELDAIKKTTDKVKIRTGQQGYYRLTNEWIIQKLSLQSSEQKKLLLFSDKYKAQQVQRKHKKIVNQMDKNNRNKAIVDLICSCPDMPNTDIALHFGVSESTIKRAYKSAGIARKTGPK